MQTDDDTWPAEAPDAATPPSGAPGSDVALQRLRAKVHGRLFGATPQPVRIGRYEVEDFLGSGGMGVVYAAVDPELDRKVALKVLRSDSLGERARVRLRREAKALARLSHPNVVHVYEVGGEDDATFIAMEFVDGGTLSDWLRDGATTEGAPPGRRPWRAVLERFVDAGRGLAAAHDAGLIHRDFKPDNVLLDTQGRPKVVDFGLVLASEDPKEASLATTRPDRDVSLTATGTLMGTPAYMAPEQHQGQPVDARTDIFAFCVALYEGLTGERPFAGETYAALAQAVTGGAEIRWPASARGVPKPIRRAVAQGLSVDPAARPATMHALLDALTPRRSYLWAVPIVGVFVGLAGYGAGGLAHSVAHPSQGMGADGVCEAASAKLQGVWDDDTRARIREAFEATDEPYAADAFARASSELDAFSGVWSEVWGQACEAALGSDAEAAEVGLRQMRCLDLRMTELRQLSDLFTTADADLVARAVDAAEQLTSPAQCVDPHEADGPNRDEDIERRYARAMTLASVGRRTEVIALTEGLVVDAKAAGLYDVAARAAMLGVRAMVTAPAVERIRKLHEVVALARQGEAPLLEAEAWTAMIDVAARGGADAAPYAELAPAWGDLAHGLLATHRSPRLAVRLQLALAQLSRRRDDTEAARASIARARRLMENGARRNSEEMTRLGQLEAEVGEVSIAERDLRGVLALNRERLGEAHPATTAALLQLAAVTSSTKERTRLAGKAFASAVAAKRPDASRLSHAAHAIEVLGRAPESCRGSRRADCAPEVDVRAAIEGALKDSGAEAHDAARIAGSVERYVGKAWRWSGDGPAPAMPSVALGSGAAIAVARPGHVTISTPQGEIVVSTPGAATPPRTPGVGAPPTTPNAPAVPTVPAVPPLPKVPALPDVPTPPRNAD